jgi:hypothetical protein
MSPPHPRASVSLEHLRITSSISRISIRFPVEANWKMGEVAACWSGLLYKLGEVMLWTNRFTGVQQILIFDDDDVTLASISPGEMFSGGILHFPTVD